MGFPWHSSSVSIWFRFVSDGVIVGSVGFVFSLGYMFCLLNKAKRIIKGISEGGG